MRFEYTVIPAPNRGEKSRDAKTPTDRFALTLTAELNRMATEGWEYLRADVLPSEERSGLTGRTTLYHNMLVFRRPLVIDPEVKRLPQPEAASDQPLSAPTAADRP
ncbi:DUF4177 domain-containing protein [Paracoccus nototheniae]|uniref:DUF4177 domain-containing protein n=1 Tax=Paracoccus nototheniae TaxID=2489002 RepID=A0ABW4DW22_9RHOB|nr:DUF4177 domain-containing protein [Paracoccus nototheniae]